MDHVYGHPHPYYSFHYNPISTAWTAHAVISLLQVPNNIFLFGISFTHNDSGPNLNYYIRVINNHLLKYRLYYYVSLYID